MKAETFGFTGLNHGVRQTIGFEESGGPDFEYTTCYHCDLGQMALSLNLLIYKNMADNCYTQEYWED